MAWESIYGFKTQREPTKDELKRIRAAGKAQAAFKRVEELEREQREEEKKFVNRAFKFGKDAATSIADTGAKALNTVGTVPGIVKATTQELTGDKKGAAKTQKNIDSLLDKGIRGQGAFISSAQSKTSGGGLKGTKENFVKPLAAAVKETAPYAIPVSKAATLTGKVFQSAALDAGVSGGTSLVNEAVQGWTPESAARAKQDALFGAVVAGGGTAIAGGFKAVKPDLLANIRPKTPVQEPVRPPAPNSLPANLVPPAPGAVITPELPPQPGQVIAPQPQSISSNTNSASATNRIITPEDATGAQTNLNSLADGKSRSLQTPAASRSTVPNSNMTKTLPSKDSATSGNGLSEEAFIPDTTANKSTSVKSEAVPTLKAYGRTIEMTKENGYTPTDTKDGGKIYHKISRTGRNNKDSNLANSWYDTNGKKLTQEQADAMVDGRLASPTRTAASSTTPQPKSSDAAAVAPLKSTKGESPEAKQSSSDTSVAQAEPINGYSSSSELVKDYADVLEDMDGQVTGGQLVDNGDGTKRRTSEHSKFYRDYYKEHGKAPSKAAWREEAARQLADGKDGLGAGEDYKKLLEREKNGIVPSKAVEKSDVGISRVAASVQQKAVERGVTDTFGDLAEYTKTTVEKQAALAVEATNAPRADVEAMIAGDKPLPNGLRSTFFIKAIEAHPILGKDPKIIQALSKSKLASEASYSAQELRLARERGPNSSVEAVKEINQIRKEAYKRQTGLDYDATVKKEAKALEKATPTVTNDDWTSFLEGMKC